MTQKIKVGEFKPLGIEQKLRLEKIIGDSLPNGLDIAEILIPAGTGLWQLDDECHLALRYSPQINPADRAACEALKQRNCYFRSYFGD